MKSNQALPIQHQNHRLSFDVRVIMFVSKCVSKYGLAREVLSN
jgi:hypothetical protein